MLLAGLHFFCVCLAVRNVCGTENASALWSECDDLLSTDKDECTERVNRTATFKIFLQILHSLEWRSVAIIHDDSNDFPAQSLIDAISSTTLITAFQLTHRLSSTSRARLYGTLFTAGAPKNIVVLGEKGFVLQFFKEVVTYGGHLITFTFHWLTIIPRDIQASFTDIGQHYEHLALVVDEGEGRFVLRTMQRQGDTTALSDVTEWSTCSTPVSAELDYDSVFPNRKYGLGGRTLKVVTMVWEPFIIRYKDGNRTQYTGLCVDLLEYIARDLNFTYVISEPPDLSWGHRLPNGTWVGMTAMLKRKEVDLALAGMSVTSERATVSDYSEGFYFDELALLVSRPTEEIGWTFFLRPFHWLVYIALGGSLIFVTAVFVFLERLGDQANMRKDQGNMRRDQGNMRGDQGNIRRDQANMRRDQANMCMDEGNMGRDQANMRRDQANTWMDDGNMRMDQPHMWMDQGNIKRDQGNIKRDQGNTRRDKEGGVWHGRQPPSVVDSVLGAVETLFGALLGRAVIYKWRQTPGGRILLSSWILVSLVTVTTYTANLTAFSVVTRQRVPFNTLRQLVKRDDYRWGFLSGTMLESILPHSSNEDYTSFYRGAVSFAESDPSVLSPDVDVQMAQVNSGQYVFLGTLSIYHHYKSRYCQLTVVSERLFTDTFAVHLQKHSPYTRLFNKAIEDAIELGLVDYWSRKRFPNNYRCAGEEKAEVMSLSLEHVQSAFLVAGMGLVAAALVFGLECLVRCCCSRADTRR